MNHCKKCKLGKNKKTWWFTLLLLTTAVSALTIFFYFQFMLLDWDVEDDKRSAIRVTNLWDYN